MGAHRSRPAIALATAAVSLIDSKTMAPDETWMVTYDADVTYNYFVTSFEGFRGVLQVGAEANHGTR